MSTCEIIDEKLLIDKRLIGTFIKIKFNDYEIETCKFKMRGTLSDCMSKLMSYKWETILDKSYTPYHTRVRFEPKKERKCKRWACN